jgi:hypothetical protein
MNELEMFLVEVESEIVLAKRILASWSFAKDPIGWNGMAEPPLTLFYTRGLGIVVLYVMVLQPYGFSLGFFT